MGKFIVNPRVLGKIYFRIKDEHLIIKSMVFGFERKTIYDLHELISYISSGEKHGYSYSPDFLIENFGDIMAFHIEEFHYQAQGLHLKSENLRLSSIIDSLIRRIEKLQLKIFKQYTNNKINHGKSEK